MIKWNTNIPWVKKSDYILRCIEESFGPSNTSGNPMITLKFEVAAPDSVTNNDGEEMSVAGIPIIHYCVTKSLNGNAKSTPEEASAHCKKNVEKLYLGFDMPTDNINVDNPELNFKGKLVYALVDDDEKDQCATPTKAELAKGIRQGAVLVNPKTKKPLKTHYPKIVEIFGLAELPGNVAF